MAAEMDYPPSFVMLESDFGNGDISSSKDEIGEVSLSYTRSRKPPRHFSIVERDLRSIQLVPNDQPEIDIGEVDLRRCVEKNSEFLPNFRSGSCSEMGPRSCMEDEFVCIDNLLGHVGSSVATSDLPLPAAFYGVFDGHGGTDAASFIKQNILKFIFEDTGFSSCLKTALRSAFLKADEAFAGIDAMDSSSGTTALTALLLGRKLLIANAGDCRAVLGRRGNAVDLSKDHKPNCVTEKLRIERLGGIVYDGYLNGQLSVSRALGDWHMKSSQCPSSSPLTAEPELQEVILTEEDEFLILGCDGLWDVMTSQYAVTITRRELMLHNDPERCSRVLVREALKLNAGDNLTVVVVCFSLDPPLRLERRKSRFRKSISADGLNILQDVLESPA